MKYTIKIAPSAMLNIDEHVEFFFEKDPERASILIKEFELSINSLEFSPNRCKPGRIMGTRELLYPKNYCIVFRVNDDDKTVDILHIYHQKQNRYK